MNGKDYLMNLCPSPIPDHIHPKWGKWSCEPPPEHFRTIGPGMLEEIKDIIHADRQADKSCTIVR